MELDLYANKNFVEFFTQEIDVAKKHIITMTNERTLFISSLLKETLNEIIPMNNQYILNDVVLFTVLQRKIQALNAVRKYEKLQEFDFVSIVEFAYILKMFDSVFNVKEILKRQHKEQSIAIQ